MGAFVLLLMHGENLQLSNRFSILFVSRAETGTCGVVVITSALHAEGPRFNPWQVHYLTNLLLLRIRVGEVLLVQLLFLGVGSNFQM